MKEPYWDYLLQCILVLNGCILMNRSILFNENRYDSTLQQFRIALRIHPDLGLARYYLGEIYRTRKNCLDCTYYYMSSLDSEYPFSSEEELQGVFTDCRRFRIEMEGKKGLNMNEKIRLFVFRFLCVLGDLWENVDLDDVVQSTEKLGDFLLSLLEKKIDINHILFNENEIEIEIEIENEIESEND